MVIMDAIRRILLALLADPRQLGCWHCLLSGIEQIHPDLSVSTYYYFSVFGEVPLESSLAPYLSPLPIDPLLSDHGQMVSSGGGYWYKVSCDRQNYKFAFINAIEDMNNVPQFFRDTTFITTNPFLTVNSLASIYSSNAKDWSMHRATNILHSLKPQGGAHFQQV